jgi:hypothetical protein
VVTRGYFSLFLGVHNKQIKIYEDNGTIPKMGWRDRCARRIWPILFIEICMEAFDKTGALPGVPIRRDKKFMRDYILREWERRKSIYQTDPDYGEEKLRRLQAIKDEPPKRRTEWRRKRHEVR